MMVGWLAGLQEVLLNLLSAGAHAPLQLCPDTNGLSSRALTCPSLPCLECGLNCLNSFNSCSSCA